MGGRRRSDIALSSKHEASSRKLDGRVTVGTGNGEKELPVSTGFPGNGQVVDLAIEDDAPVHKRMMSFIGHVKKVRQ